MKTIRYKSFLLILLIPALALATGIFNGRYTKEKKISKQYEVNADALLEIENSYGTIDVTTWDQNRVEIEVIIKTNGNDKEAVIKRLKEIDVAFDHSSSHVRAVTLLEEQDSSWWNIFFGDDDNVNIEINYLIRAPVTNNVELFNDYGNIQLDNLLGNSIINCDYGKILIGKLGGDSNVLNFDYSRGSKIDFIKKGEINADYSEFIIEEAGSLKLNADYSESRIDKVENLIFNCDYGSIRLGITRNVKGQADYIRTEIGAVYRSAELSLDYGSFSLERIMAGARDIDISSDYTSVEIGFDNKVPFSFEVSTSYGGVDGIGGDEFKIEKRNADGTDNYYQGFYLSSSEGALINIDTSYGNVTFKNNN